jgi:hypothetical protein
MTFGRTKQEVEVRIVGINAQMSRIRVGGCGRYSQGKACEEEVAGKKAPSVRIG